MRAATVLGVVFGALFLLIGVALLAGASVSSSGGNDSNQFAERGLAGPVDGRVTAVADPIYTVEYTDTQGTVRTGRGAVAQGTTAPAQGDDVQVHYSTADPTQIILLDVPGGSFAGVAGLLRTIGIVCLVVGAVLLLAGLLGLVLGRLRAPARSANPVGYAPRAAVDEAQSGDSGATRPPPPDAARKDGPRSGPTPTEPPGSDPGQVPPAGHNRPGG